MNQAQTISSLALRMAQVTLWLFLFSIPMEKSVEIPGLGTISRVFGLIAIAAGGVAILLRREIRLPGLFHWVAAAFICWSAVSYLWTLSPESTEERLTTYAQLLAVVLLIWQFCPTVGALHQQLSAYVAGTTVPALDTFQRFLSGKQTYYQRYATTGFDPNDLAITLAISLPIAYYLSLISDSPWWRWVYRAQMAASIGIILLTASRTGLIATLVALTLVATTAAHLTQAARRGLIVTAVLFVALSAALVPASSFARLATLGSEVRSGNVNGRTVLWSYGWRAFSDGPLGGVGAGAYPEALVQAMGRQRDFTPVAHNSFLSVLVETGLIGICLFVAGLCVLVSGAWRLPSPARQLWLTALAVWTVGVMALTWEQRKPTWVLFGLVAAHAAARPGDEEEITETLWEPEWQGETA